MNAALFDLGVFMFHNGKRLYTSPQDGVLIYIPKIRSYEEAQLWNSIFQYLEQAFNMPKGVIKATVTIEMLSAAFEMEEIVFALNEYVISLTTGRWNYIHSIIQEYQEEELLALPSRNNITIDSSFLSAFTKRVVHIAHKRGTYALGGVSAYLPRKGNKNATEYAKKQVIREKIVEAQ